MSATIAYKPGIPVNAVNSVTTSADFLPTMACEYLFDGTYFFPRQYCYIQSGDVTTTLNNNFEYDIIVPAANKGLFINRLWLWYVSGTFTLMIYHPPTDWLLNYNVQTTKTLYTEIQTPFCIPPGDTLKVKQTSGSSKGITCRYEYFSYQVP